MTGLGRFLRVWRSRPVFTRRLFLFTLLSVGLVNAALYLLPWTTPAGRGTPIVAATVAAEAIRFGPRVRAASDSWRSIFAAHDRLGEHPGEPLYRPLLEEGIKFQYPPTSILLSEIAPRDRLTAATVFNGVSWVLLWVNGALVGMILLESCRRYLDAAAYAPRPGDRWRLMALAILLTVTAYPIARALQLGQVQAWINALTAGMIWLAIRGRWAGAGALTGLICIFKPHYALLLAWFVLRGKWRAGAAALAVLAPAGLLSLALYGWAVHVDYLRMLSFLAERGEVFHHNQSVNGLLNRLVNPGSLQWSPGGYPPYSVLVHAGTLASSVVLIGGALTWPQGRRGSPGVEELLIAVLSFTIAAPIAWEHHYGALLPIFAWALPALAGRPGRWSVAALAVSFILVSHALHFTKHFADTAWSPLQSYRLLGGLVALVLLYVAARSRRGPESDRPPGPLDGPRHWL